ncbi:MAG: hypothetical protein Q9221_007426 [Calogaya cf. arnoldii]
MATSRATRRAGSHTSSRAGSRTGNRTGTQGRQLSARPKTRNLIRWNDDLDKKLLLTIQWACNQKGVKIPMDLVASEMSSTGVNTKVSAGAVIQHLAKFRVRMVQQGLSVPPPLSRGGNNNPATAQVSQASNTNGTKAASTRRNKKPAAKKSKQEDSEEETEEDKVSGSEAEVPKKPSTQAERKKKAPSRRGKTDKASRSSDIYQDDSEDVVKEEATFSADDQGSQTRYGVGDSMWHLDGVDEGVRKSPSKIVILGIGQKGFEKLGVSAETGSCRLEDYADDFEEITDISDVASDVASDVGSDVASDVASNEDFEEHKSTEAMEENYHAGTVLPDGFKEINDEHVDYHAKSDSDQNQYNGLQGIDPGHLYGGQSSFSPMGSYHSMGNVFAGFHPISFGDHAANPMPTAMDYMVSGAPVQDEPGAWESCVDAETFGFGF